MDEKTMYAGLIARYGKSHQVTKAIEEFSELQKELCKYLLNHNDASKISSISEEIADCKIMIEQLELMLGVSKMVDHYRKEKLKRIEIILMNS